MSRTWMSIDSEKDMAIKRRNCLNAYMFWIGEDCYSIKVVDAFKKYGEELWWICYHSWVNSMILKQDPEGLEAMRVEYTKITGLESKSATLKNVYETLGYCQDLYANGKVMENGMPNIRAMLK